jgi:hypothetical protein
MMIQQNPAIERTESPVIIGLREMMDVVGGSLRDSFACRQKGKIVSSPVQRSDHFSPVSLSTPLHPPDFEELERLF